LYATPESLPQWALSTRSIPHCDNSSRCATFSKWRHGGAKKAARKAPSRKSIRRRPPNKAADRKAALAFEKEQERRERERAKEEAAQRKERERRQKAVDKTQSALDAARRKSA
jgi:hypothetical protein